MANVRLGVTCASLGHHGREHRAQMLETFTALAHLARSEQVQAVLLSGDLFDCAVPGKRTLDAARIFFQRLADAAIPVIVLPGARDPEGIFNPAFFPEGLALCPHARVLGPACPVVHIEACGLQVEPIMLPELPAPVAQQRGLRPTIAVGLAYLGPQSALDATQLASRLAGSGWRYVGIGGDPNFSVHVEGEVTVCSPGMPEPHEWGQNAGTVALVRLDDTGAITVERRRRGIRRFLRRDFEVTLDNARHVMDAIRRLADQALALEIVLTGSCPLDVVIDPAAIEKDLAPSFFHLRVIDHTSIAVTEDDAARLPQGTIVTNFARVMAERIRDASDEVYAEMEREAYQVGLNLLQGTGAVT